MIQLTDAQDEARETLLGRLREEGDFVLEALDGFNRAIDEAYFDLQKSLDDYFDTCSEVERFRQKVAKSLKASFRKIQTSLDPEQLEKTNKWIDSWDTVLFYESSRSIPDSSEYHADEPDLSELHSFEALPAEP